MQSIDLHAETGAVWTYLKKGPGTILIGTAGGVGVLKELERHMGRRQMESWRVS